MLTARLREKMGKAAVRAAEVVGYSNVGTVEFLLAGNGEFYFIEMNTRIQVEHGVTEMVTGIDLVKESIRVAMGEPLALQAAADHVGRAPRWSSASTPRIPTRIFRRRAWCRIIIRPAGSGVRVETALYDGYRVPVHYDPLIAKLIVHAENSPRSDRARQGGAARVRDRRHQDQHPAASEDSRRSGFHRGRIRDRFPDPL